jgi:ABC-type polysaccharide/polyol phosphate export permease
MVDAEPLLMLGIYFLVFRYVLDVAHARLPRVLRSGSFTGRSMQDCSFSGLVALTAKAGVLRSIHLAPGGWCSRRVLHHDHARHQHRGVIVTLACVGRLSPYAPLALLLHALCSSLGWPRGRRFLVAQAPVSFRDTGPHLGHPAQAWFWLTAVVYKVEARDPGGDPCT